MIVDTRSLGRGLADIPSSEPTLGECKRASLVACANATDRDDAVTLLKMLGLYDL